MKVSVIIPTLNEESCLPITLDALAGQSALREVLVVDGGSQDATIDIASRKATLIRSDRGRAIQMNTGARSATGEILLFLHADTQLPEDGLGKILVAIQDQGAEAGAFRLKFDHHSWLLDFYSYCTRFSMPSICFGDRGLFVKKEVFIEIGGFPLVPLFEDLMMVELLYRRRKFLFLEDYVTTASRRFDARGHFRQQLLNLNLWLHYMTGTPPEKIKHLYTYPTDCTGKT